MRLAVVDPLARPAPGLAAEPDTAATGDPAAKIAPALAARLRAAGGSERVPLVVELREPLLRAVAAPRSPAWDAARATAVAALEHRFAAAAAGRLAGLEGLSHFPIVFGSALPADVAALAALPDVRRVHLDEVGSVHRVEGARLTHADGLRAVLGGDGRGIGVAVLDTGVAPHPELASRIVAELDTTGTTGDGTVDDNGHGTQAAGIAAGSKGMAPAANVWAIKVALADGRVSASALLKGLNAVYSARQQLGGVHVLNLSLGFAGPIDHDCADQSQFSSVLTSLVEGGVAVFASAGNDGFADGVGNPACHPAVLAVGAVYDGDLGAAQFDTCADATTAADKVACYSNSGEPLDVLAPAHCATTTLAGGGLAPCFGGTSAAAPYAAGIAAQLLSLRPQTTPAELYAALRATGRPIAGKGGLVRNRVDALAAHVVLSAGATAPCLPDGDTLCLDDAPGDRRFAVAAAFDSAAGSGAAHAIPLAPLGIDRGGVFWFFSADNPELMVKVLDGCPVNGRYWVFVSAGTNVGVTISVRDTASGAVWAFANPRGRAFPTVQDTLALPCD